LTKARKVIKVELLREDVFTDQNHYSVYEYPNGGRMNREALDVTFPIKTPESGKVKVKHYELCTYRRKPGGVQSDVPEEEFTQDFLINYEDIKHTFGFIDTVIRKETQYIRDKNFTLEYRERDLMNQNKELKKINKELRKPWWKKLFKLQRGAL